MIEEPLETPSVKNFGENSLKHKKKGKFLNRNRENGMQWNDFIVKEKREMD